MEGVSYILSDKLNQDPIEEFFGKQRAAGGDRDHPNSRTIWSCLCQEHHSRSSAWACSRKRTKQRVGECAPCVLAVWLCGPPLGVVSSPG
ncbi:hypothetical protein HOLleu_43698 [Holothuria leucospilota]|uniref:Uncharacterized protein n=1 Tax=Holothuria leucospilota TaxID=206669 RepID=A0A9Q0YAF7_HOLLE|nr:hypothetical protein HOLleu_43698 [Holothuria leucospilota]